jgi:hypothetical protein
MKTRPCWSGVISTSTTMFFPSLFFIAVFNTILEITDVFKGNYMDS